MIRMLIDAIGIVSFMLLVLVWAAILQPGF